MRGDLVRVSLLLGALVAACGGERPEQLVIGIALTEGIHPAVELAAGEINEAGGVDGVPIELAGLGWTYPGGSDSPEVLQWAQRFAEMPELVAVVGHSDSSSTLSAAAVYNQHQVPQIVTIATHPAITSIGDWTYRLCVSDAEQGPALARYAVEEWGQRRVALFFVNDDYGRGLARVFEAELRRLGGEVVTRVFHRNVLDAGDRELIRHRLAALREEPADLVVLFQRVEAADWTVRAIREEGLDVAILGGDNLGRAAFVAQNAELKDGIRVSQFFDPGGEEASRRFVEAFRAFAGKDPDYGHAFAYDAIYLLRDALLHGGFSRQGVKSYLDRVIEEGRVFTGAGGPFLLAPDHDARRSFYIAEVRGGRIEPVAEIPVR